MEAMVAVAAILFLNLLKISIHSLNLDFKENLKLKTAREVVVKIKQAQMVII